MTTRVVETDIATGQNVYKTTPAGDLVDTTSAQSLTNKTFQDTTTLIADDFDITKKFKFDCFGITTATTRTAVVPNQDGTLIVSDTTNRVHNSVPSWNVGTLAYEDGQDGYADLLGHIDWRTGGGANAPTMVLYVSVFFEMRNNTGGAGITDWFTTYHLNHDWVAGEDLFIHPHWSVNVAGGTGNANFIFDIMYGTIGSAMNTQIITLSGTSAVAGQYIHVVQDFKIGDATGSGGLLNTTNMSIDGLLQVRIRIDNGNVAHTLNVAARDAMFIHQIDLHYKSSGRPSRNKEAPFNT